MATLLDSTYLLLAFSLQYAVSYVLPVLTYTGSRVPVWRVKRSDH